MFRITFISHTSCSIGMQEARTAKPSRAPGFSPGIFGGDCVSHLINCSCCDLFFVVFVFVLFLVYPLLLVSLDCQLSIASLVFSRVYLTIVVYLID